MNSEPGELPESAQAGAHWDSRAPAAPPDAYPFEQLLVWDKMLRWLYWTAMLPQPLVCVIGILLVWHAPHKNTVQDSLAPFAAPFVFIGIAWWMHRTLLQDRFIKYFFLFVANGIMLVGTGNVGFVHPEGPAWGQWLARVTFLLLLAANPAAWIGWLLQRKLAALKMPDGVRYWVQKPFKRRRLEQEIAAHREDAAEAQAAAWRKKAEAAR